MSAASYGIGSWLGHGFESFNLGNELERAGMHGLADGLLSAIDGHNFGIGFACGALSSFGGSGQQAAGLKSSFVLAEASALTGESVAWALGDDFFMALISGIISEHIIMAGSMIAITNLCIMN